MVLGGSGLDFGYELVYCIIPVFLRFCCVVYILTKIQILERTGGVEVTTTNCNRSNELGSNPAKGIFVLVLFLLMDNNV